MVNKRVRFNLSSLCDEEPEHDKHIFIHKPQLSSGSCLKKSVHPPTRLATNPQPNTETAEAEGPPSARKLRQEALNHLKRQFGKEALHPHDLLHPEDQSPPAHATEEVQPDRPHFEENQAPFEYLDEEHEAKSKKTEKTMTEPRARAARHKGQLNFPSERKLTPHLTSPSTFNANQSPTVKSFLYAFGDDTPPLPETVRVLDEIVTDFIIESCHNAARSAQISKRQKIKLEDFNFAVRGSEVMLGRVREMLATDKTMKEMRRQFNTDEGKVGLERGGRKRKAEDGDEEEKVEKTAKKKVKGEEEGEK